MTYGKITNKQRGSTRIFKTTGSAERLSAVCT